jgi:hypothetical protein
MDRLPFIKSSLIKSSLIKSPSMLGRRRVLRSQRGSVALAAIACLVITLIIVLALTQLVGQSLIVGKRARTQAQLRALTDGGLVYGYYNFAWSTWGAPYGSVLPKTATNISLGPGTFSETTSDNSSTLANTFKVVCTGKIGNLSLTETRIYPQPWDDPPNYSDFYGANQTNQLSLNGNATLANGRLRLTDGGQYELSSVFTNAPIPVTSFHIQFTFQIVDGILYHGYSADGFTFCIQNNAPWTTGGSNQGGLGYGPQHSGGTAGIPRSVAVKFDLYDNDGEGYNSTGCYTDGAAPTMPATDLTSSSVNLRSGNIMQVNMTYSGTTLTVKIKDTVTGHNATQTYSVNLYNLMNNSTIAYFGFTAATGYSTTTQDILTWTYTSP